MARDSSGGSLDRSRDEAEKRCRALFGLADDFDRWGLAPEAETARLHARQETVDTLIVTARAAAAQPRRLPRMGQGGRI